MKIADLVCSAGYTGFYFDDQRAIKAGAPHDGFVYTGQPITPGFSSIRQAGESISVLLVLEDGRIAYGDCVAVQYSGAGGRDPLFLARDFIPVIETHLKPALVGQELDSFRRLSEYVDHMAVDGRRLHTAIRYGVTQAILDAVAQAKGKLMCEVIAEEYHTTVCEREIPIFAQSGDDRYSNAEKAILKGIPILPHALINQVDTKLGRHGELLLDYCKWLSGRILALRKDESYNPILHLDVYGTIGQAFGNENYEGMADYLERLCQAASPFRLQVEGPMDMEDREKQMIALRELTRVVDRRGIPVKIVADEWCNTQEDIRYFAENRAGHIIQIKTPDLGGVNNIVESVLYCNKLGIGAYQGGSCNESDRSAQICVHLAMGAGASQILCKPGMGVDEGYCITYNEMHRILALRAHRGG